MTQEYNKFFGEMKSLYVEDVSPIDLKAQKIEEEVRQIQEFKNRLDPVGEEDDDVDNDGDRDKSDSYLLNRRSKRSKAIRKHRKNVKEATDFVVELESPYDWRSTLDEDIQAAIDDLEAEQITEKPVNNYAKGKTGKPVVKINPNVELKEKIEKMGGEVIYLEDDNLFIQESIEIATNYFCEEGLTYQDVEDVIESIGSEVFCEWFMDLMEDIELNEARTLVGKKKTAATGKERGVSLKAAPGKTTKARVAKGGSTIVSTSPANTVRKSLIQAKMQKAVDKAKTAPSQRPPGQERIIKGAQDALKSAVSPENRKKVGASILAALKTTANVGARAVLSGLEGHKAAMKTKTQGGSVASQLGRGAGTAISAFMKKGTSHLKEYIEYLMEEGYDLSEITLQELIEDLDYIEEKAVSEQQQKLFGAALSVKRGQTSRSKVSEQVLNIVDTMSEKEIRKFAKTKHDGIPQKVDEGLSYDDILNFMNY